ncbi:hypothetical protein [Rossellomorea marisflavi]|uniref:hypothetical protein n=1 Tax=Rossellomorea marisflavi TaxID=189381 RepID=UPI00345DB16E
MPDFKIRIEVNKGYLDNITKLTQIIADNLSEEEKVKTKDIIHEYVAATLKENFEVIKCTEPIRLPNRPMGEEQQKKFFESQYENMSK